jgi:hypothetical protein
MNKFCKMRKDAVVANLKHYTGICVEGMRKMA